MWTITSVIWAVYSNHSFTNISAENINFHIFILRLLPGMRMRGIVNTQNTHKQQNLSKVMSIRPSMAWQPGLMLDVNGLMITWSTPRVAVANSWAAEPSKYRRLTKQVYLFPVISSLLFCFFAYFPFCKFFHVLMFLDFPMPGFDQPQTFLRGGIHLCLDRSWRPWMSV